MGGAPGSHSFLAFSLNFIFFVVNFEYFLKNFNSLHLLFQISKYILALNGDNIRDKLSQEGAAQEVGYIFFSLIILAQSTAHVILVLVFIITLIWRYPAPQFEQ